MGSVLGLLLHRFLYELMITSNWGDLWQPPIAVLAVTILAALLTTFASVHFVSGKLKYSIQAGCKRAGGTVP